MSRVTRAAQVPTRLAGSSLEACAPRAKSQLPRLADAPLSPGTRRAPPRKGRAQFDNPDSSVQNTIYASENARFETQQTITNGGRAKVAGASRPRTSDKWPRLPVASRARLGAFRSKRPEVSRDETRERNAADPPVSAHVCRTRATGPSKPASRTVHVRLPSIHVSVH